MRIKASHFYISVKLDEYLMNTMELLPILCLKDVLDVDTEHNISVGMQSISYDMKFVHSKKQS